MKTYGINKIINLTPHKVVLRSKICSVCGANQLHNQKVHCTECDELVGWVDNSVNPEPTPARVASASTTTGEVNGIPLISQKFEEVTGLPQAKKDTIFIVSRMVMAACPSRQDLCCPADLIRNDTGDIVACGALERL